MDTIISVNCRLPDILSAKLFGRGLQGNEPMAPRVHFLYCLAVVSKQSSSFYECKNSNTAL